MWHPVDTGFYVPRLPVGIVVLPGGTGAASIRNLLELLDCVVLVHWIGTPSDFLKVIGQGDSAPRYLIIEGHGAKEGLHFGEYASFIDTSMLKGEYLPAEIVRQHVKLPGCIVIALTCDGGTGSMASAFLAGQIKGYIGCRDAPDGVATYVFLANFFYSIRSKQMSDRDAWYRALKVTDHDDIYAFSYFHPDATEDCFA